MADQPFDGAFDQISGRMSTNSAATESHMLACVGKDDTLQPQDDQRRACLGNEFGWFWSSCNHPGLQELPLSVLSGGPSASHDNFRSSIRVAVPLSAKKQVEMSMFQPHTPLTFREGARRLADSPVVLLCQSQAAIRMLPNYASPFTQRTWWCTVQLHGHPDLGHPYAAVRRQTGVHSLLAWDRCRRAQMPSGIQPLATKLGGDNDSSPHYTRHYQCQLFADLLPLHTPRKMLDRYMVLGPLSPHDTRICRLGKCERPGMATHVNQRRECHPWHATPISLLMLWPGHDVRVRVWVAGQSYVGSIRLVV
ncbi:hypothetical protein K458DRAFT_172150 [Lentithecium fluviatile CBS 122367]|uniref:Uncharacterized protein n=1 Tax=Lentithecium fluviatile CBS 122367 TaxID=1168545 RepID=A0A6G1JCF1_9PLEO|nr:hypothetical protein K458DRAFT_172150 [Lentithecium fluviatile CBS 122367]